MARRKHPNQVILKFAAKWVRAAHGDELEELIIKRRGGGSDTMRPGADLFAQLDQAARKPAEPPPVTPAPPPTPPAPPPTAAVGPTSRAAAAGWRAGIGYRSVKAGAVTYSFTAQQGRAVELLWREWEAGTPDVPDEDLLRACGTDATRLNDVFRGCTAWGRWIVEGGSRGTHRLADPA